MRDVAGVDGVDDVALVGRLDGERGDDDALARVADGHVHVAEGARPQPVLVIGVVDRRGHLDEARRGIRGGRDEDDVRAVGARALPQGDVRRHVRLDARGVGFGDGEAQEQGIALEQRGEHRARLQVLPGLDGARLDDAREGSAHGGVPEVELRDAHRLLRGVGVGLRARDARRVLLDLLAGHEARVRGDGPLASRELGLCGRVGGDGLGEGRLGLVDRDVVALDLDADERVALLDGLSLDEGHLVDRARHARGDLHLLEGVDAARRDDVVLDLAHEDGRDLDRVLQLARRLGSLEPRVLAGFRAGDRPREREEREHEMRGEPCRVHLSSVPSGSSPMAWRRLR